MSNKALGTVLVMVSAMTVRAGRRADLGVLRTSENSEPTPVHLTLHEGTNLAAALSPDGRTLATDLLGTLWTLPSAGGAAKAISDISMDVVNLLGRRTGSVLRFRPIAARLGRYGQSTPTALTCGR